MGIDRAVIAPVAHGYVRLAPEPVEKAVGNLIHNLDEPRIAGNDILQIRFKHAGSAIARFVLNSTIGLAGLFDPATGLGLKRHESDFGQTLGRYGVKTGPYVFVPFFGPSDLRDGLGGIADLLGDPVAWATGGLNTPFNWVHVGASMSQGRVEVGDQMTALHRDFTDPYAALRSIYSQNRALRVREARGESAASAVQGLPQFGSPAPDAPAAPAPGAEQP